jgi:hypothetical protein
MSGAKVPPGPLMSIELKDVQGRASVTTIKLTVAPN